MSVWRLLKMNGYRKVKPTTTPGLNAKQKSARLQWCLDHKDWTLEDWKKVIWSDETSVIYGLRRGGERVWRTPYEKNVDTCRRNRWKVFSEFMFGGCFSYDFKGPCHVWETETAAEKRKAENDLNHRNEELEEDARLEWELSTGFRRKVGLRKGRGRSRSGSGIRPTANSFATLMLAVFIGTGTKSSSSKPSSCPLRKNTI